MWTPSGAYATVPTVASPADEDRGVGTYAPCTAASVHALVRAVVALYPIARRRRVARGTWTGEQAKQPSTGQVSRLLNGRTCMDVQGNTSEAGRSAPIAQYLRPVALRRLHPCPDPVSESVVKIVDARFRASAQITVRAFAQSILKS